jgi:multiple sugar transport system substrate-binding protein
VISTQNAALLSDKGHAGDGAPPVILAREEGGNTRMSSTTRRSVLRGSAGLLAAAALARPHIANAAATTASMWLAQGFIAEEDAAYKAMVDDYQKASGNTIDYSIIPFAALRQKMVSAVAVGVVPDLMETADFNFLYLNAWKDNLLDVSDIFEKQKDNYSQNAHDCAFAYNSVAKKRAYYYIPWKSAAVPFRFWKSLVEKSGQKMSDIPNTWDAFNDFFRPVQDGLRKAGMRSVYAMGYQLTATGVDPILMFNAFMIANGGENFVTPQGQLMTGDPQVREAAIKAATYLAKQFTDGYVPPVVLNWNDADDNNAFHAKLMVMDFDGSLSTEVAVIHNKTDYDDIKTYGLPLSNDGKKVPAQIANFGVAIPKGAKNIPLAKEFMTYFSTPKVLNTYLKAGLGRWVIPMPEMAKSDPFWLKEDEHRTALTSMTLFGPTIPVYEARNPGMAPVGAENVMMRAVINVMKNGMTPQAAIDQAFKRVETILGKYPVVAS